MINPQKPVINPIKNVNRFTALEKIQTIPIPRCTHPRWSVLIAGLQVPAPVTSTCLICRVEETEISPYCEGHHQAGLKTRINIYPEILV